MKAFLSKNVPVLYIVVVLLIIGYSIVRYYPIIILDPSCADGYFYCTFVQATFSILDNVLAGALFAALAFYFKEIIIDTFTKTTRISSFYGYEDLSVILANSLASNKKKKLHVTILMPMLFSEEIAHTVTSSSNVTTSSAMSQLASVLASLIGAKEDSYERILVGRTSKTDLNGGTWKFINREYFSGRAELPPTTGVGYHPNLNEIGVFILCEQSPEDHSTPGRAILLVTAIFSRDFNSISGFASENAELIRASLRFHDARFKEAADKGWYFENRATAPLWDPSFALSHGTFQENFKKFLTNMSPKEFRPDYSDPAD